MITGRAPGISRRKFIRITGTTLALASLPVGARLFGADQVPLKIGGLTRNEDFYITSYSSTPHVDINKWTLRIHGLVNRPITLTYSDIKRLPSLKQVLTLECIGNPP